jgi:uncharacterized lipoprotein
MFTRACLLLVTLAALSACSTSATTKASANNNDVAANEAVRWDDITGPAALTRVYNSNMIQQR